MLKCVALPSRKVIDMVEKAEVPLILVEEDSFTAASEISHMIFKLRAEDKEKIRRTEVLIERYVNVDKIFNTIKDEERAKR